MWDFSENIPGLNLSFNLYSRHLIEVNVLPKIV